MSRTSGKPRRPISRRRFLALIAAGSAAAAAAPAQAIAAVPTARVKPATAPSPRVRAEIEKQKQSLAETLKTIRNYALPAGSDMAFEFRPLSPRRGKR